MLLVVEGERRREIVLLSESDRVFSGLTGRCRWLGVYTGRQGRGGDDGKLNVVKSYV